MTKRVRSEEYLQKQREYNKRWYQANKDYVRNKTKLYRENHPEKEQTWTRTYRANNPDVELLRRARNRAKLHNLEFNLEREDIYIPKICPYLKIPLTLEMGIGHVDSNMSLDRIDNTKGYIKGNVEVISHLANKMKHNASWEQLEAFSTEVLRRVSECGCEGSRGPMCSISKSGPSTVSGD